MSQLRQDPISGNWVIIAAGRAKRPNQTRQPAFAGEPHPSKDGTSPTVRSGSAWGRHNPSRRDAPEFSNGCPFCEGHESQTPPEVYAVRSNTAANTPGWRVRVVPNKFPAVSPQGEPFVTFCEQSEVLAAGPAVGFHEVTIESPRHDLHFALQDTQQAVLILEVLLERYRFMAEHSSVRQIIIFKNHGGSAGASLPHPHFQTITTPIVPPQVQRRLDWAKRQRTRHGKNVFDVYLQAELADGERIIASNEEFLTLTPWASTCPFELWLLPRRAGAQFGRLENSTLPTLAESLRDALLRIYYLLNDVDYNLLIHTAPIGLDCDEYYRWYVQILPRLSIHAGFELATGMHINTATPERCAQMLRGACAQSE